MKKLGDRPIIWILFKKTKKNWFLLKKNKQKKTWFKQKKLVCSFFLKKTWFFPSLLAYEMILSFIEHSKDNYSIKNVTDNISVHYRMY